MNATNMGLFASKLWILLISTFILVNCVNANDVISANFVKKSAGDIPSSDVLGTSVRQVSILECASLCLQNQDCLYFAKRTEDKSCVLISNSIGSSFDPTNGISVFYEKKGSPAVDPCLSHFCINGGSCLPMQATYLCLCNAGYTGEFCQTDIDFCSPNPCLNGGTCTDGISTFTCGCPRVYSGVNCSCEFTLTEGKELVEWELAIDAAITDEHLCLAFCSIKTECVAVDFCRFGTSECWWYTNSGPGSVSVSDLDNLQSKQECDNFKKKTC